MKIVRTGIILNVENFAECVAFYKNLFGLRTMHSKSEGDFHLECLEFGGNYLMIETEGKASSNEKSIDECPAKIRFNVEDINDALETIIAYGIDAEIERNDWGANINICDPDGNRVGVREEKGFG